jgi:hypothetical protein
MFKVGYGRCRYPHGLIRVSYFNPFTVKTDTPPSVFKEEGSMINDTEKQDGRSQGPQGIDRIKRSTHKGKRHCKKEGGINKEDNPEKALEKKQDALPPLDNRVGRGLRESFWKGEILNHPTLL